MDLLAIFAHPDDAELLVGGTLALAVKRGKRAGVLTLTRGESASRGTAETRAAESRKAAAVLGLAHCESLDLGDGDLENTQERRRALVGAVRRLRPRIVLANALDGRHPDHRRANELVRDAVFLANVGGFAPEAGPRWETPAIAWPTNHAYRPDAPADWIVDISETWAVKMAAIECYSSQVRAPQGDPNATYVSSSGFLDQIAWRAKLWGHLIGTDCAEAFHLDRPAHAGHPLVQLFT